MTLSSPLDFSNLDVENGSTLITAADVTVLGHLAAGGTLEGSGTVYLDGTAYIRALELDQPLVNAGDATLFDGDMDLGEAGSFTNQLGEPSNCSKRSRSPALAPSRTTALCW